MSGPTARSWSRPATAASIIRAAPSACSCRPTASLRSRPPMLIAQITDTHIKPPGKLAYRRVDTASYLERAIAHLRALRPQPEVVLATGDLVDAGTPEEYGL